MEHFLYAKQGNLVKQEHLLQSTYLGAILHRFRDTPGFCAHDPTPIPA